MKETSQSAVNFQRGPSNIPLSLAKDISLTDIIATIRRRKLLLFVIITGLTLLTAAILFFLTPRFTAQTLIMIDSRGVNLANLSSVARGLPMDAETIEGEIEVLRSPALAEKVIEKYRLDGDKEFYEKSLSAKQESKLLIRSRVHTAFSKKLNVSQKGRSRVISIEFTSADPQKATNIANTIAEEYLVAQLDAKYDATRRATEWLSHRVATLRQKAESSEAMVQKFRHKTGLLPGKETSLSSQQLTELNTQLILAKAARAEAEARLEQTSPTGSTSNNIESSSEVLSSKLIQNLQEQESNIKRKLAELSTEYGMRHPKMINLRAEAQSLESRIKIEIKKIAKGLGNEVAIAKARETSLEKSIAKINKKIAASSDDLVKLNTLKREAETNQTLLKTMLTRMKETHFQEDKNFQQADARIVSEARIPTKPSFPKKIPIILLAFMGSTVIGLMLIFLFEHLDQGFRSGEEIEQITGVTSLGFVPLITESQMSGKTPMTFLQERPKSAFGESINTLRWSVTLPSPDKPPKKILFTSTQPKESKTTISVGFAMMHARAGKKVVLIDADCRMPRVNKVFNFQLKPGLTELLTEEATLEETLQRDEKTTIDVITAGKLVSPNPSDVLASDAMDKLLEHLEKEYDIIIIDSPPVMAASDAMILSKKVDTSVFIVRWSDTKQAAVRMALKQFQVNGGPLAGVLMSMVDVKKHSLYSYGDSSYYSGRLENYYTG